MSNTGYRITVESIKRDVRDEVSREYEMELREKLAAKDQRITELEAEVADLKDKICGYEDSLEWCGEPLEDDQ